MSARITFHDGILHDKISIVIQENASPSEIGEDLIYEICKECIQKIDDWRDDIFKLFGYKNLKISYSYNNQGEERYRYTIWLCKSRKSVDEISIYKGLKLLISGKPKDILNECSIIF